MQDRALAAIGNWHLEKLKNLPLVDLYIENMYPGEDYQIILLVFEFESINGELICKYKGIDIEKVSGEKDDYRKYAYRKGSSKVGDFTFTTKISSPSEKKISTMINYTFKNILDYNEGNHPETIYFKLLSNYFNENKNAIIDQIDKSFKNFSQQESIRTGFSLKLIINQTDRYLRDFELIKEIIIHFTEKTNFTHSGEQSKAENKISSVSGNIEDQICGFAAPFTFSTPDKKGFISGFFKKELNWRNYPISSKESLILDLGKKYIKQNLNGYFYGSQYMCIPHPIVKTNNNDLEKTINLLKTAFDDEKKAKKEYKKRAEDRIQKIIAQEKNYFYVDLMFYKEDKKNDTISIDLMLEELLPSRFRQLFIDVPEKINKNKIFKNEIVNKNEIQDLTFNFEIVKNFFDTNFLDVVQKIFVGKTISSDFLFEKIMYLIRKNYDSSKTKDKWVEPIYRTVLKAIMLMSYLQELKITTYNKNFKYMEIENINKKESRFDLEGFNNFVKENQNFLDSNIKVGIFSVGVLARFLFDIQSANLNNTPFEHKLRGYKLNPELLMQVYTEALDKIQKYQKNFYVYTELRDIINQYFLLNSQDLYKMTNNELSFYFVAGLEMGKKFKNKKEEVE